MAQESPEALTDAMSALVERVTMALAGANANEAIWVWRDALSDEVSKIDFGAAFFGIRRPDPRAIRGSASADS